MEHVYETHPSLYILAFGMVAAKVTNRLVVSIETLEELKHKFLFKLLRLEISKNDLKFSKKFQVAHMTKSEMDYMDWSLVGPALLFFNQYFNTFIPEHIVLWLCMVRSK